MNRIPTSVALSSRMAAYAAGLRERGVIRTDAVERAFATVPRHLFLPGGYYSGGSYTPVSGDPGPDLLDRIYSDTALMTHVPKSEDPAGRYSSTSQPRVIAAQIEALRLARGMKVLEVGAGTGYNAGLIAAITSARVVTVDVSDVIAAEAARAAEKAGIANIVAVTGDGYLGHPDLAPYDRIVATCGVTGISPQWIDQLADDGLIVVPMAHAGFHPTVVVFRDGKQLAGQGVASSDFMRAAGPLYAWPGGQTQALTEPLPAEVLTTLEDVGPHLESGSYYDLWFYLGTRTGRATRAVIEGLDPALGMACIHRPALGTAWIQRTGELRFAGDASVADELARYVQDWVDNDQPAISDHHAIFEKSSADQPAYRPVTWYRQEGPGAPVTT